MAVNWYWKDKAGQITFKSESGKYSYNIYAGSNCMAVILYEYKDKETNKDMYIFQGFWDNLEHLKRCMGIIGKDKDNLYQDVIKLKLNIYYLPKEWQKIAELFAKHTGAKIELYYKAKA